MLKDFVKKFDDTVTRGLLKHYYGKYVQHIGLPLQTAKITPLPRKVRTDFTAQVRYQFFQRAQAYLQVNRMDGVYAEFGSHEVNTFRMALRTLGLPGKPNKIHRFYAFDSFQGMPEPEGIDKQKIWRASMNFTSKEKFEKIVRRDLYRSVAVKGFFNESLPAFDWPTDDQIVLAYVDCDYYSSTKDCLNFLKDKMPHGALLAFDDWDCYYADPERGQKLAFREYQEEMADTLTFIPLTDIPSGGMCFVVLEKDKMGTAHL